MFSSKSLSQYPQYIYQFLQDVLLAIPSTYDPITLSLHYKCAYFSKRNSSKNPNLVMRAHILLISYLAQGHLNPTLQFAKRLIRLGAKVTFVTTVFVQRHISKSSDGLTVEAFSDGHNHGFKFRSTDDMNQYLSNLKTNSSEKLKDIIKNITDPITFMVYAPLLPWVGDVARSFRIPFALLWIQPATVLGVYCHYFNGYKDKIWDTAIDPSFCLKLPGLPLLASRDLPSFLLPTCPPVYSSFLSSFKEQIQAIDAEKNPTILVNTFDELELEALKAIEKYKLVGIGPLVPSAFLDQKDLSDRSFGGDLFQKGSDYVEWLNSKPGSSVIYVSFGSVIELATEQMEEIAYGLVKSERPFLWVIREKEKEKNEENNYTISCIEELMQKGMIVPWCSQLEVLSHPSLGCFITHCGWNSTLESLVMGVPMVAFPQWSDQATNAKLIEDVWKTGVRVREGERKDDGKDIVDREEVKRCIEMVMGNEEKREELRTNAVKWKNLARASVLDGGTSDTNLKAFVKEIGRAS